MSAAPALHRGAGKHPVPFPEFVWIWNRMQGLTTPTFHLEIARWLSDRWRSGDRQLVLLAFRNSGKSSLVGLFCAWLLFDDPNHRILVLAGDFALARKMVRNVKRIIERHPLSRGLRPSRPDQWAADQFTVQRKGEFRDPSMLAKGIASNITGLRADVVICDDVEVPNTCDTASKRADLRTRIQEIEYVIVPGGLQLFIGTPHSHESIYAESKGSETGAVPTVLSGFTRLTVPLVDEHGRSRWPERYSLAKIREIRERTGPAKFDSQMMLRPRSLIEARLDAERLRAYDAELVLSHGNNESVLRLGDRRLVSVSCWWDPSYGAPNTGDSSVLAVVFTDSEGAYWLHRVHYLTHDPQRSNEVDEATQLCRQVVAVVGDLYLPSVALETNGLGRFLAGLLRRELRLAGLACSVIEKVSSRNKAVRIIEAFDAVLAAGRLWVHRGVWQTPFVEEMQSWRPDRPGRDDGLDAVAGCLLNEPVRLPRCATPLREDAQLRRAWRTNTVSLTSSDDFAF